MAAPREEPQDDGISTPRQVLILFGPRTPGATAARRHRQHGRDHDRVVRLPDLQHRDRVGFRQIVLSRLRPAVGTLQAFGVFFIGFVARPIGAAIFGHYGDRIGRKATLIVNPADDRHRDRRGGPGARATKRSASGAAVILIVAAPHPGRRRRRRVGRFGVAGDGVGTDQQEPRLHRVLAAIRLARRPLPGQPCGVGLQRSRAINSSPGAGASRS